MGSCQKIRESSLELQLAVRLGGLVGGGARGQREKIAQIFKTENHAVK